MGALAASGSAVGILAPAVREDSLTLPQGDGDAGPVCAGRIVGRERKLTVLDAGLFQVGTRLTHPTKGLSRHRSGRTKTTLSD
jgi:hypothetical protein